MWDFLRKEMKGFNAAEIEGYIENYGFKVSKRTKGCVYAVDKYGYAELFFVDKLKK